MICYELPLLIKQFDIRSIGTIYCINGTSSVIDIDIWLSIYHYTIFINRTKVNADLSNEWADIKYRMTVVKDMKLTSVNII